MWEFEKPPAEHAIHLIFSDFLKADAWAVCVCDSARNVATEPWGHWTSEVGFRVERMVEAWRRRAKDGSEAGRAPELLGIGRECAGPTTTIFLDLACPLDDTKVCMAVAVWEHEGGVELANEYGSRVRDALREFYLLQLRAFEAERLTSAMRRILDCFNAACVITDREGKVAYSNRASEALLQAMARERSCARPGSRQVLRDLLAGTNVELRQNGDGSGRTALLKLKDLPGASAPAYVMRLDNGHSDQPACELEPLFGILVPNGEGLPDAEALATGLRITRSESRLAALIIRGKSIQEAAAELGLSEQTGRTYLKRIFTKIGISRQTQLGAAAATLYLPLGEGPEKPDGESEAPRSIPTPGAGRGSSPVSGLSSAL